MKYLVIQSNQTGRVQTHLFPISDSKKLDKFYLKLKRLFLFDIVRVGGFYLVSDLPREMFDEWEWGILLKIENFQLKNLMIMTQYEYNLIRVIDFLGMRKKIRKQLGEYLKQQNKKILQYV